MGQWGWLVGERWLSAVGGTPGALQKSRAQCGSIAGGTDPTCPRDSGRDEGRKRKLTRSEPDTEGIYYNLKWGWLQPCFLNPSQDHSIFFFQSIS